MSNPASLRHTQFSRRLHRAASVSIETLEGRRMLSASGGASAGAVSVSPTSPVVLPVSNPITGLTLAATAGVQFKGAVALWHKTGPLTPSATSSFSLQARVSIQWGDGTSSAGTLSFDATGVGHINGAHTYAQPGPYKTTIGVVEVPVGPGPLPQFILVVGTANGKAIVTGKTHNAGVTFYPIAGKPFTGTIAHLDFHVPPVQTGIGLYVASINWGDGTTSLGKFVDASGAGASQSDVVSSHTYSKAGQYKVVITVTYGPSPQSGAEFPTRVLATLDSTAIVHSEPTA